MMFDCRRGGKYTESQTIILEEGGRWKTWMCGSVDRYDGKQASSEGDKERAENE